ncbi:dolichyl-phosphate beta-glucosyltransferase [Entophlyctis luteolus]|nr:dolichyl-phosphate beta-glucosyltransferase [Entophlyctis luteolus]KAJ3354152.1 dolichyl-phosphate beta-glucosyltransferase [Entophlyctis luteolus]
MSLTPAMALVVAIAATAAAILAAALSFLAPHPRAPLDSERRFVHCLTGKQEPFPRLESDPQLVDLSVIIPAYNEELRLPKMLNETLDYLIKRRANHPEKTFEIIVVDDGSKDSTASLARSIAKDRSCSDVRVLVLAINRGKGGAVTQGMLVARGANLLFADADGASQFSDVAQLESELARVQKNGHGIAVGSRAHMVKSEAVVKRSFVRNFLMHGFHTFLLVLGIAEIKDTQCGFKMISRKSAISVFPNMHVEGWIFDIEMLLLASWLKIPMVEVPITWHEIEGSKVSLIKDSIKMAIDLLIIRCYYAFGLWKVTAAKTSGATRKD